LPTTTAAVVVTACLRLAHAVERAELVVSPQRFPTVAELQQPRVEAREVLREVLEIAMQQVLRFVVDRRVDDLRHVDQRQALVRDEDVERREVAVNHPRGQQPTHL